MTGALVPFPARKPRVRPASEVLPEIPPFRLIPRGSRNTLYVHVDSELPLSRVRALISMLTIYADRIEAEAL